MSDDQLERNKQLVEKVVDVILGDRDNIEKQNEVIAVDYIQHNPHADQGLAGVKRFFREELIPKKLTEPASQRTGEVNVIAEGEFVVRQDVRSDGMLIDIFRVKDGLIREHWDAFRPAPGTERHPFF